MPFSLRENGHKSIDPPIYPQEKCSNGRMRVRISLSKRACRGVCVSVLLAFIGCRTEAYVVPEGPMPANTVLLSQMMRELSATPGFTDALLSQLDQGEI